MPLDVFDNSDGEKNSSGCPYIGVLFECCGVYARIYRRHGRKTYEGRCPKCLRKVRARVGKDGTAARIFRAS